MWKSQINDMFYQKTLKILIYGQLFLGEVCYRFSRINWNLCGTHDRSSHRRCSIKKGVLRNFTKFTGKHLCRSLFFNKVVGWGLQLYWKGDFGTVFSWKFCEISKNASFSEHLWATAFDTKISAKRVYCYCMLLPSIACCYRVLHVVTECYCILLQVVKSTSKIVLSKTNCSTSKERNRFFDIHFIEKKS